MGDNLKATAVRGLFWGSFNKITSQVLGLAFSICLARLLSPADYGLVGLLTLFTVVANLLQESGFTTALIREEQVSKEDYSAVFWFNVFMAAGIYLILFLGAPFISHFFQKPLLVNLSRFIFLSLIFTAMGVVPNTILSKDIDMRSLAKVEIVSFSISGFIGVILAFCGYSYWALAFQQVCNSFFKTLYLWIIVDWKPIWRITFSPLKKYLSYSIKLLFTGLVNQTSQNIYSVLLGRYYPIQQVGYYNQGYNLYTKPAFTLYGIIVALSSPLLAKRQSELGEQIKLFVRMIEVAAFVSFPVMFGFAFIAKDLLVLLVTDKWLPCLPIIQLFSIWGGFLSIHGLYVAFLVLRGHTTLNLFLHTTHALLLILVLCVGVSKGVVWMVLMNCVLNFIMLFSFAIYVNLRYRYTLVHLFKDIFPYFFLTVVIITFVYYLILYCNLGLLASVCLKIGLVAGLYAGLLRVCYPVLFCRNWNYMKTMINRK